MHMWRKELDKIIKSTLSVIIKTLVGLSPTSQKPSGSCAAKLLHTCTHNHPLPSGPRNPVRFPANSKVRSRLEHFSLAATSVCRHHPTLSLSFFAKGSRFKNSRRRWESCFSFKFASACFLISFYIYLYVYGIRQTTKAWAKDSGELAIKMRTFYSRQNFVLKTFL